MKALVANVFASVTGAAAERPGSTASSTPVAAPPVEGSQEATGEVPQEAVPGAVPQDAAVQREAGGNEAEREPGRLEEASEGAAPDEGGEGGGAPGGSAEAEEGGEEEQQADSPELAAVEKPSLKEDVEDADDASEQTPAAEVKSSTSLLGGLLGGFFGRKKPSEKPAEKAVEKAGDHSAEKPREAGGEEVAAHVGRLGRDSPFAGGLDGSSHPGPGQAAHSMQHELPVCVCMRASVHSWAFLQEVGGTEKGAFPRER